MFEAHDIQSGYGDSLIVKRVSFSMREGEIVAIIGPNGAGKSTLLKTLFGLIPARRGRVLLDGKNVAHEHAEELIRRGMGFVPQGRRVFADMTVEENLRMGGYLLDRSLVEERMQELFDKFPILREKRLQRAHLLSGGQQQLLSIGRALMMRPRLLLLDEPSMGLAPIAMSQMFKLVQTLSNEGTGIILVEQNAFQAVKICTQALVLEQGKVVLHGGPRLLKDKRIRKVYFGD